MRSIRRFRYGGWILLALICSVLATWRTPPDYQHPAEVDVIELSPNRSLMATRCGDGVLRMWEVGSGRLLWSRDTLHRDRYGNLEGRFAFAPDGRHLALAGGEPGEVLTLDANSGTIVEQESFEELGEVCGVGYSPDGSFRATLGERGELILTSRATQMTERISLESRPYGPAKIRFSPDGSRLAISGEGFVCLVELKTREVRGYPYSPVTPAAVSTSLDLVATPGIDNQVVITDLNTMEAREVLGTAEPPVRGHEIFCNLSAVAFSADGRFLATSFRGWSVSLWDLESKRRVGGLECRDVRCIRLLDNNTVVVGRKNGKVEIGEFRSLF